MVTAGDLFSNLVEGKARSRLHAAVADALVFMSGFLLLLLRKNVARVDGSSPTSVETCRDESGRSPCVSK
jgi:hypothetical protein